MQQGLSTPLPDSDRPTLSVVTPMLNEEATIDAFFARLCPILDGTGLTWEIICVDDGSTDRTLEVLRSWHMREPRIRTVSLSRNFNKERALTAGLACARGQAVIPIDADLQDPPEVIPALIARWQQGFDMVVAVRDNRDADTWLKRHTSNAFYILFNRMSQIRIPENTGDFRLMSRRAVDEVLRLPERNRFMKGLFAWVGFPTATVPYTREERVKGISTWTYWRLWNFALDGITSFSTVPLRVWSYFGLLTSAAAFAYAAWIVFCALFTGIAVPGYASLIVVMLFLGGIQLIGLGIIGEYIGRIYQESKNRPLYVIKEKIGFSHNHRNASKPLDE